jgi:hypothetical protein
MDAENNVIPIAPNTIATSRRSSRTYNSPGDEHQPGTSRIFYLLTVEQFPKSTNNDSESIGPHQDRLDEGKAISEIHPILLYLPFRQYHGRADIFHLCGYDRGTIQPDRQYRNHVQAGPRLYHHKIFML